MSLSFNSCFHDEEEKGDHDDDDSGSGVVAINELC